MVANRTSNDLEPLQEIRRCVNQFGRISVDELSQKLSLSQEVINSGLQTLAERRQIVLTYNGGASLTVGLNDLSLALRTQRQSEEKGQIAEYCTGMIQNGDTVFLDSSSTALAIASHLKDRSQLTVISNCLGVVQQLPRKPDWQIIVPGGAYQWETDSLVGLKGVELIQAMQVERGFFGAHGISLTEGATDVSQEQAQLKRLLSGLCRQVIVAVDATKWNQVGRYPFAKLDQITLIVTDSEAQVESIEQVRARGIEVIVV